ncbi:MoxR-like ATPase in aerotolerance operon [hydrothermal vent metagenome]|uniref:MoxR-like ATPase in aerotolerance operon n=1 Tax=hydrothermal vent metagenome TaxID=652676 RepID=A0A1W1CL48_9ZZZZ
MTAREAIVQLQRNMNASTIGQNHIVSRLIMGLLADGNILIEGLPGLAKTRVVRSMADFIDTKLSRIQFTPDLKPSDVMGEERIYHEEGKTEYKFHEGAIFGNIILADEVNRAPAKVQSAMLEAMEEKQVTIVGVTHKLPELFVVMATQNPIEHEGTFPLSEAQKDRFLMHIRIDYVDMESEFKMVKMILDEKRHEKVIQEKIPQALIFAARDEVADIKVSDEMGKYMVELVFATRYPVRYSRQLGVMIDLGISPRGTLVLSQCAKVHAWMRGKKEVDIEDIEAVIHDVFRHRLVMSEHALMNNRTHDEIIDIILEQVPKPKY